MWQDFHFIRPLWLLLLPVCLLLVWLLWRTLFGRSNWQQYCDPLLLKALLVGAGSGRQWLPLAGLAVIWAVATIALAGPSWQRQPQPVFQTSQGRLLLFDLSLSMNSTDVLPSRLIRARYKLADLVRSGAQKQQALVVFAGDAWVVSPFTDDSETLLNLIPALDVATAPIQGSRVDLGLSKAFELINNAGLKRVEIVLLTDGLSESQRDQTIDITNTLSAAGHRLAVLSVGTVEGAPITMASGALLKDNAGNIVIPGVDLGTLQLLADAGRGKLLALSASDEDLKQLAMVWSSVDYQGIDDATMLTVAGRDVRADIWFDMGGWLLLPILLLAAFGFRRGWILCLVLVLTPIDRPVYAFGWSDLWSRADQQAAQAFSRNQYDHVPSTADAIWRGAAAYRQDDMDSAIGHYSKQSNEADPTQIYNLGNAFAKNSQFEQAIEAYDKALALRGDFADATFNRELVQQLLDQQQQQQQSDDQQQQQQQQQSQDDQEQQQPQQQSSDSQDDASEPSQQQSGNEQQQQTDKEGERSDSEEQKNAQQDGHQSDDAEQEQAESEPQLTEGAQTEGPMSEQEQALEQWLKKVPDDPGGLLRRKFHYQQSQRQTSQSSQQTW